MYNGSEDEGMSIRTSMLQGQGQLPISFAQGQVCNVCNDVKSLCRLILFIDFYCCFCDESDSESEWEQSTEELVYRHQRTCEPPIISQSVAVTLLY